MGVYKGMDAKIAHMAGVKAAVHAKGREIEARANVFLAPHRRTGQAHIEGDVEDTDYVVSLVDPAALSIEFGRGGYTTKSGAQIGPAEGLHVLRRAAGI
jgi:hypothetical protein